MFFVECLKCDVTANGFHAKNEGWVVVPDTLGRDWLCSEHADNLEEYTKAASLVPVPEATIHDLHEHVRKTAPVPTWSPMHEHPPRKESAEVTVAREQMRWAVEGIREATDARDARWAATKSKPRPHPLQQEFGFMHVEDGSEERYHDRVREVPWAKHTFWWVIHNAVAHPLIALFPKRLAFRFHDYTSRKMHDIP